MRGEERTKPTDRFEPPHGRGRRLYDPNDTVQTGRRGCRPLQIKIYLQSHRCKGILDRFEPTKAFLREEGGTRSVTEGACATLKSDETLLQRALPQSPTAPAPSRREPIYAQRLKSLQSCGIIMVNTTRKGTYHERRI